MAEQEAGSSQSSFLSWTENNRLTLWVQRPRPLHSRQMGPGTDLVPGPSHYHSDEQNDRQRALPVGDL
eukprot:scaffold758_cov104-Cylindrotheca_fusiformis.AAC.10